MSDRALPASMAALLTDFYQLTMMAGYVRHGRAERPAVFEYFFRGLPEHTGFCVFAGLEDLLSDMENLRFTMESVDWLASLGTFDDTFLHYLKTFRFNRGDTGGPRGYARVPNEPIVRVQVPIAQAQLSRPLLLNS